MTLSTGTCVQAAAVPPQLPGRSSCLKYREVLMLPHTGQVIAARLWVMLVAACLTVFGIGAELGYVGVLGYSLSAVNTAARVGCLVVAAIAWVTMLGYGVAAIRALANPKPGSALTATGTSFTL